MNKRADLLSLVCILYTLCFDWSSAATTVSEFPLPENKSLCWTCAGEPDSRSPTEVVAAGWSSGLQQLQGHEEERRPLLSDRKHGGSSVCACVNTLKRPPFPNLISLTFESIYSHQGSELHHILQPACFCVVVCLQYDCQYCQYHVKAQYKKMSAKRADLQSSFSGKAPNKVKGKGGSLRERLCQDGFYYGGVSSSACAASLWVMLDAVISLFRFLKILPLILNWIVLFENLTDCIKKAQ